MKNKILKLLISAIFLGPLSTMAKTVHYELTATQEKVNLSGKKEVDFALLLNGGIPAPTLEFTEGDVAEIVVKNRIPNQEVSIHWHGILLPPEMDGVPYVTTMPIKSGTDHVFRFPIRQHGTYWYHSHTDVQEQKGIYGAIVIHPKQQAIQYDKDVVVVLSDWSDENATDILKNLRKDGDYYLYKKGTMRSWLGAINAGALGTYLDSEWTRMGAMDLSDVGYDAFLINGKRDSQLLAARPGDKIRLRVINASASSYFYLALGQAPMKVIAADGVDIEPRLAKDILIGMAETYDILFEVPANKNYEFRATAQDGTGFASGWIGSGDKVAAPDRLQPDMYASMDMSHGMHMGHDMSAMSTEQTGMDHSKMDHSKMGHDMNHGANHEMSMLEVAPSSSPAVIDSLTVDEIKSPTNTELPKSATIRDIKLVLDGDMARYVWHINGKTIAEDRNIEVKEGEALRFTFENKTMMHHPMHLHGHFFRVVNKNGSYSPLKHTVDVPPHGTRVIEFSANEPGEWMLHCHNLYHLKTGMARVVKYVSFTPKLEIQAVQKQDPHAHDHWYFYGKAGAGTNLAQLNLRLSQTWNEIDAKIESAADEEWKATGDLFYRRWFGRFTNLVLGGSIVHDETRGMIGIGYILPMLVHTDLLVDQKGKLRVNLDKRFQWTKYIFTDAEYIWRQDSKFDNETRISLMYAHSWAWAAGVQYTGNSFGVGFQYQF